MLPRFNRPAQPQEKACPKKVGHRHVGVEGQSAVKLDHGFLGPPERFQRNRHQHARDQPDRVKRQGAFAGRQGIGLVPADQEALAVPRVGLGIIRIQLNRPREQTLARL